MPHFQIWNKIDEIYTPLGAAITDSMTDKEVLTAIMNSEDTPPSAV